MAMKCARFKYKRVKRGKAKGVHAWQYQAKNGEIVCVGEGHVNKADNKQAVLAMIEAIQSGQFTVKGFC